MFIQNHSKTLNKNLIHFHKDFQFFIGKFDNNQSHKHYAIQLSIPLNTGIEFVINDEIINVEQPFLIKPNLQHRLRCESDHLIILLNPASTIGHYWNNLIESDFKEINTKPVQTLQNIGREFLKGNISQREVAQKIKNLVLELDCFCNSFFHSSDDRIDKAISYLKNNRNRVIPLEEIAETCFLSPSRFLHLFKETTGISYRRAQLWVKLQIALPLLLNYPITKVAHEVGFSDSAHFSRTFKENFGFPPKALLKLSQFIQV